MTDASETIRDPPPLHSQALSLVQTRYQQLLDSATPHTGFRWAFAGTAFLSYALRILVIGGFHVVTYFLFLHYLFLLVGFISPQLAEPDQDEDDDEYEDGPYLPQSTDDEFHPFMRRLPEFKLWRSFSKSTLIGLVCTFFPLLDIPVFWPLLLVYFAFLAYLMVKRRIQHMMKYRYVPFDWKKPFPGKL